MNHLCADERCAAASFEYVEIDTLALERESVLFHLGNHLYRMATDRESGHVEVEVAVGRAASGYGVEIALHPIDIERD